MIHIYAIILAVILLVGALAGIIICVCVDIVPIIKSRGSTLMSRDSVTQEQAMMLKKSIQRNKLTSSASADFIDTVQGRHTRAQALRKSERPRFGSTPLALLSGDDERNSDVEIKTTTVIIEALPKGSFAENNNNGVDRDVSNAVETNELPADAETPNEAPHLNRAENVYTDNKPAVLGRSGSFPNVARHRPNSADLLNADIPPGVSKGAMTYNSRDPRFDKDSETQSRSYPNSPNMRATHSGTAGKTPPRSIQSSNARSEAEASRPAGRSKIYPHSGMSLPNGGIFPRHSQDFPTGTNNGEIHPQACDSHCCKWCQIERERISKDSARARHLPFNRSESFPETASPRMNQKSVRRQHSFEEEETAKSARQFPYDRNKFCKNPHQGYSPCPECFHCNNHPAYYPYAYPEMGPAATLQNQGVPGLGNPPHHLGPLSLLTSSASSSSSSGSSTRFRHLRQPLEDIQEDASDCYTMRGAEVTSTIDSRELDSSPDDETMPKSPDNSVMSVSPILPSEKPRALFSISGS